MPICTVKHLHAGFMPATSTRNLLTLIPMSKSLTVMKSWWGIAKMRNAYKLLTCFLVRWLTVDLNYKEALLDGNSGVSQDHMPYCSLFLEDAEKNLLKKGSFVYTTFLDFRTDFSSRSQRLKKLYGRSSIEILSTLKMILQGNTMATDDRVTKRYFHLQMSGFAQGDDLSALLFTLFLTDFPQQIQTDTRC